MRENNPVISDIKGVESWDLDSRDQDQINPSKGKQLFRFYRKQKNGLLILMQGVLGIFWISGEHLIIQITKDKDWSPHAKLSLQNGG